jgi:hypothetical protein
MVATDLSRRQRLGHPRVGVADDRHVLAEGSIGLRLLGVRS